MPINITMPALSPTMEEGDLAKWLVKEGDSVAPGDVIAEIETDKATMEVEAVDEGTVAKIVVPDGTEGVKVNALIAILAEEGEDPAEAAKSGGGGKAEQGADASTAKPEAPQEKAPSAQRTEGGAAASTAQDKDSGNSGEGERSTLPLSGLPAISPTRGESTPAEAPASGGVKAEPDEGASSRVFASPLARRLAREAGLDLAAISGSGPHGRVVKADVEKAKAEGGTPAAAEPGEAEPAGKAAAAPAALSDDAVLKLFAEGSYERVPHDAMRRTIARRLVEAKQTVPHFYLTLDCDIDALLALRKELNAAAPERDGAPAYKLSVNDLVIKAYAAALKAVPDANVSWTEGAMLKHAHADVGVAVSIPGGLITPIVRRADEKTLSAISNEMKDLAARARERKLKPEEYQGGTGAVSNLGMFGIKDFAAVINPPHATILAVGAGEQRAVVKDGEVAVATIMSVTLSTDHRAVDGALGAELLAAFRRLVENPMAMLV